jgi:menaquinone-dependent protoporphyrinogen oxidase
MNVLVVYASRLGSTGAIARRIAIRLGAHGLRTTTAPVGDAPDVSSFDAVVIGTALYAGHVLKEARHFVEANREALAGRPVWVFSSGPVGDTAARSKPVVPGDVAELARSIQARDRVTFAGSFSRRAVDRADLSRMERVAARRLVPEGDWRDWPAIETWADGVATELVGAPWPQRVRAVSPAGAG